MLAPRAPSDAPSAASFYVPSLPDIHQDPNHPLQIYAGQLPSDPAVAKSPTKGLTPHLYFVMVKNRRVADKKRIMFWFNGGPGCSSFDGLMMEIGPWRMDGKGGFKVVEGGWEEYTTMVYIDQPAGTGFSLASTDQFVHTLDQASVQLLEFLRNFYLVFPEYMNMDTYIGGESYAGQYIPYFADAILNSKMGIHLKGAAIGNGWIDARRQYATYIDYAVKVGILEDKSEAWKKAKADTDICVAALDKIKYPEPISISECEHLLYSIVESKKHKTKEGVDMCLNIYDVRFEDTEPACGMNWPPDIKPITTYLDRKDVVRALHATEHTESWTECRPNVHRAFRERESNSSILLIPKVLAKIPVLIFAGDQDLICNYVGQEAMIQHMTWNGAKGLGTVETQSWSVSGAPAGTWVSSRNLTYAKIFNASHMAPFDLPHVAHDMILRFMGVDFAAIAGGTAKIPSSLGTHVKPVFAASNTTTGPAVPTGKTPSQDKAMWEAYYNAGSAGVVLILIVLGLGTFIWCRVRQRRRSRSVRLDPHLTEENIPLNASHHDDDSTSAFVNRGNGRKGKGRAGSGGGETTEQQLSAPPIFGVGDDDDDDGYKSDTSANGNGNARDRG